MYRLGIDLGGTKIEGIVLDDREQEVYRQRIATEQQKGYRHILQQIKQLHDILQSKTDGKPTTFGIGTPGAVSPKTGVMKNANTQCLIGKPLKSDLQKILDRKNIVIQNDANCFAMAEVLYGAGAGKDLVFGVIIGTGCGGGIVYKKEVFTGPQAIAGEWGHMSIDPNGPKCYCGLNGCIETFISGGGLEKRYRNQYGEKRVLSEIVNDFRAGNEKAFSFMSRFFVDFGRSIANLINILDPDIVVLGGGVSNIDEIYSYGIKEVATRVFSDSLTTPIVRHKLGDSAGVIGAALIAEKVD